MNWKRFKHTLIWTAANRYKRALTETTMLFFAFLLVFCIMLGMNISYNWGEEWETSKMYEAWGTTVGMAIFVFIINISTFLKNMRANDGRVMTLMLPANSAEKFWAAYLWSAGSTILGMIVAVICADLARVLFSYILGWQIHGSMVVASITNGFGFEIFSESMGAWKFFTILVIIMIPHSTMMLGGVFFRRSPAAFTLLSMFAISTLLGICVSSALEILPSGWFYWIGEWFGGMVTTWNENLLLVIFDAMMIALIALHFWLAYKVFCRIQVISNKWINI